MKLNEIFQPKLISLDRLQDAFNQAKEEQRAEIYQELDTNGKVEAFSWGGLPIYFFPQGSNKSATVNKGDFLIKRIDSDVIFAVPRTVFLSKYKK